MRTSSDGAAGTALRVTALGKRYHVRGRTERYQMLRDSLARAAVTAAHRTASLLRPRGRPPDESGTFWALRDVSFSVEAGEIVGVIGANGAGKSTLLKILSRITAPTVGRAEVRGRVGSLLEVGTGFHPELTGRDNVLLSGVILGMRRAEVLRNFDAIVAFADVERFIDTPVKRYSSGMYLRLAFAVAAHLQPDILFVDEVLAVGDAAFQKKCLGTMSAVARGGRTVLFVSHNMVAVQSLCTRALWLQGGRLARVGETHAVVADYLRQAAGDVADRVWDDPATAPGNEWLRLRRAVVRPEGAEALSVHTPFALEIEYWSLRDAQLAVTLHLFNQAGVLVFCAGPSPEQVSRAPRARGLFRDVCRVPGDLLNDGGYRVELFVMRGRETVLHQADFLSFTIHDSTDLRGGWLGKWPGAVRPNLTWTTEFVDPMPVGS